MVPPKLDPTLFTWQIWRAGSPHTLGLACRECDLISARGKTLLREHIVGWCLANELQCSPKGDHVAVMCYLDGEHFWFHLTTREFQALWG